MASLKEGGETMSENELKNQYDLGMIGLGVMGCNLLYNIAEHGFPIIGFDLDKNKVETLKKQPSVDRTFFSSDIREFVGMLKLPRIIVILVPAGSAVDAVISNLSPYLGKDDILIDAGNSHFIDTDQRSQKLSEKGINFLGTGISGGEEGARRGPCIMPGGDKKSYERVRPVFEAVSAKVDGFNCVTYIGNGSAGHFVKMVHNGIEYALMQLISETYDIMKRGLGLNDDQLNDIYQKWNETEVNSYLIQISAEIFRKTDKQTGKRLIDEILDVARQKGTGMWTSQIAMEIQVPIPTIDTAVSMRDLSGFECQREEVSKILKRPVSMIDENRELFLSKLKNALYTGIILTYAQGVALMQRASIKYEYRLDIESIARIWRGGCIIRSALLEDIQSAYSRNHDLQNLLLDDHLSSKIIENEEHLREVIIQAIRCAIPVSGFTASLGYLDAFRSDWLPANLIQAQRDYFGSHTYERIDSKGTFHTEWQKE